MASSTFAASTRWSIRQKGRLCRSGILALAITPDTKGPAFGLAQASRKLGEAELVNLFSFSLGVVEKENCGMSLSAAVNSKCCLERRSWLLIESTSFSLADCRQKRRPRRRVPATFFHAVTTKRRFTIGAHRGDFDRAKYDLRSQHRDEMALTSFWDSFSSSKIDRNFAVFRPILKPRLQVGFPTLLPGSRCGELRHPSISATIVQVAEIEFRPVEITLRP
jgi:hypothetical protein